MMPQIDHDSCTGCGKCAEVCPPRAIESEGKKTRVDEEYCEECGLCASACPVGAISIPFPRGET